MINITIKLKNKYHNHYRSSSANTYFGISSGCWSLVNTGSLGKDIM